MRVQIGNRVAKRNRNSQGWECGAVHPRVIKGKATEEVRGKRHFATRLRAVSAMTVDAHLFGYSGEVDDLTLVLALAALHLPGDMIVRARQERSLTQVELAGRAGISVRQLRRIERGSSDPRSTTLRRILEVVYRVEAP